MSDTVVGAVDSEHSFSSLTLKIEHDGPIPLRDFSEALDRFAVRFGRFSRNQGLEGAEARLAIASVSSGSAIIELVATGAAAHSVMEAVGGVNNLVEFGRNVATLLNGFRSDQKPADGLTATDCDDVRAIVKPVITTEGGGLSITVNGSHNDIRVVQIGQDEARQIDNRAAMAKEALADKAERLLEQTLFVWKRIEDTPGVEPGKRSPDKGIISAFDSKARQVSFDDPAVKAEMYGHGLDPFGVGFVVDAKVLVGPNGPQAYLITRLHDTLTLGDD
jgi:hypothetical protein